MRLPAYLLPASLRCLLGFALLCLAFCTCQAAPPPAVLMVLSESTIVYQAYAQAFLSSMGKRNSEAEVSITSLSQISGRPIPESALIVAVGGRAAEVLIQRDLRQPLLLSMLTRDNLERMQTLQPKAGGIYIDQPAARYVALVRAALPNADNIGLLQGQDSRNTIARITTAAREQRMQTRVEAVAAEAGIFPAMRNLLTRSDVIMATPDATVYNAQTIPSILLSTYRRGIPVVGYSPAYVNAGALIALYSTPEQLAAQSADICVQVLAGGAMPGIQSPRHYTIGINERVAHSLGLALDSETVIRERLEHLERQP